MPTATGPNGEKLVLQNGQWVPLAGAAPTAPTVPAAAPSAPITLGRPDPYKIRDQQLQEEAAGRAREDQQFQREKFEREMAKGATDPKLVEAERTAAFLATRVAGGINDINKALAENPSANKPSVLGSAAGIFGKEAQNWANTPARRRVEAAQLDILDAALTLGTGAAYTTEQLENYRQSYFPTLTDDEATIADKKGRLARLLESAKVKAGGAAPKIDEALKALGGDTSEQSAPKAAKLTPEQQQEFFGILEKEGPEAADAYLHKYGLSMKDPKAAAQPYSPALEYAGEFADSTGNIVSGMIQGAAALPDLAAKTAGQIMALPVDLAGFDEAAEGLRHPFSVNETVESINPTPTDTLGKINRFGGQVFGSMVGFPQKAAQSVVNRIVGAPPPMPPPNALAGPVAAARRQNIEMIPADVGGPTTRRMTAGAVQSPYGAGPVIAASERSVGTARAARDRIAAETGKVLPEDEAGEVVRQAADVFSKQTSQRGSRLYERADKLTGGAKVSPAKAIEAIDQQIAELAETPELNQLLIRSLEKLKSDFAANGGVSVGGLRNMRTALRRESMTEGLRGGDTERRFGMVLDALKDDIATGIPPAARQAFLRADTFWAKRVETIDDVLEPIIGKRSPKSGEDILKGIESMAQGKAGGAARFRQLMTALPEDEASAIRATVISRLGNAKAGNQNAAGTAFSPAEVVTRWNVMSTKGKSILFGNGPLRQALDDLVEASGAMKAAGKYANTSNTAGAISANMTTAGLGGAGAALMTGHPLIAAAMTTPAIAQRLTGKLMASPKFVRWLARTPKDPRGLNVHVSRLSVLAEANPAIRNDVLGLQQAIVDSLNQAAPATGRLAASPDQGPQDGAQPQ